MQSSLLKHNIGSNVVWNDITQGVKLTFDNKADYWYGAGNGTYYTGAANTANAQTGLIDGYQAHDFIINTQSSEIDRDRGIVFGSSKGGSGWRLGKWHSGVTRETSLFAIDGTVVAKGGTDFFDFLDASPANFVDGIAAASGTFAKPSIVAAQSLFISGGNGGALSVDPELVFHHPTKSVGVAYSTSADSLVFGSKSNPANYQFNLPSGKNLKIDYDSENDVALITSTAGSFKFDKEISFAGEMSTSSITSGNEDLSISRNGSTTDRIRLTQNWLRVDSNMGIGDIEIVKADKAINFLHTTNRGSDFAKIRYVDDDNRWAYWGDTTTENSALILEVGNDGTTSNSDVLALISKAAVVAQTPNLIMSDVDTSARWLNISKSNSFIRAMPYSGTKPLNLHYNSSGDFYILFGDTVDDIESPLSTLRPFKINSETGLLSSANGQSFSGGTNISNTLNVGVSGAVFKAEEANVGKTIGGLTWANGMVKIAESETTGWAFDGNEIYAKGEGIIGAFGGAFKIDALTSHISLVSSTNDNLLHNSNKVWTAGNDGSGSGLDADLLDGRHASDFIIKTVGSSAGITNVQHYRYTNWLDYDDDLAGTGLRSYVRDGRFNLYAANDETNPVSFRVHGKVIGAGLSVQDSTDEYSTSLVIEQDGELRTNGSIQINRNDQYLYLGAPGGSYSSLHHTITSEYGFASEHGTSTAIRNLQGLAIQAMILGDSTYISSTGTLFGISNSNDGGVTWDKQLELKGNGDLHVKALFIDDVDWDDNKVVLRGNAPNISFQDSNSSDHWWQVGTNGQSFYIMNDSNRDGIYDTGSPYPFQLRESDGSLKIFGYKVWTQGNDGAGSGLDADTLAGYSIDNFLMSSGGGASEIENIYLGGYVNYMDFDDGTQTSGLRSYVRDGVLTLYNNTGETSPVTFKVLGKIQANGDIHANALGAKIYVGQTTGAYSTIQHQTVNSHGFTSTYNNATVISNMQGGGNQAIILGDSPASSSTGTVFGVSSTVDSGATWTPVLDLKGDGTLNVSRVQSRIIQWKEASLNLENLVTDVTTSDFWNGSVIQTGGSITEAGVIKYPRSSSYHTASSLADPTDLKYNIAVGNSGGLPYGINLIPANGGKVTVNDSQVWHAGNDGAGSGLDADLLGGYSSDRYFRNDRTFRMHDGFAGIRFVGAGGYMYIQAVDQTNSTTGKFYLTGLNGAYLEELRIRSEMMTVDSPSSFNGQANFNNGIRSVNSKSTTVPASDQWVTVAYSTSDNDLNQSSVSKFQVSGVGGGRIVNLEVEIQTGGSVWGLTYRISSLNRDGINVRLRSGFSASEWLLEVKIDNLSGPIDLYVYEPVRTSGSDIVVPANTFVADTEYPTWKVMLDDYLPPGTVISNSSLHLTDDILVDTSKSTDLKYASHTLDIKANSALGNEYFDFGEMVELLDVTANGDSRNFLFNLKVTTQSSSEIQVHDVELAVRSGNLPDSTARISYKSRASIDWDPVGLQLWRDAATGNFKLVAVMNSSTIHSIFLECEVSQRSGYNNTYSFPKAHKLYGLYDGWALYETGDQYYNNVGGTNYFKGSVHSQGNLTSDGNVWVDSESHDKINLTSVNDTYNYIAYRRSTGQKAYEVGTTDDVANNVFFIRGRNAAGAGAKDMLTLNYNTGAASVPGNFNVGGIVSISSVSTNEGGQINFTSAPSSGLSYMSLDVYGTSASTHNFRMMQRDSSNAVKTLVFPAVAGTVWSSGNDGSGSGMDADLWDGAQFSTYIDQPVKTTSDAKFNTMSVYQTDGIGRGISLYSSHTTTSAASPNLPTFGLAFAKTSTFGSHADIAGSWSTYFTLGSSGEASRGWIFRADGSNKASIDSKGKGTFTKVGVAKTDGSEGFDIAYNETTKSLDFNFIG